MLKMALLNNRNKRMDFLDRKRDYVTEPKSIQSANNKLHASLVINEEELLQMEQELMEEQRNKEQGVGQPVNGYLDYSEEEIIEMLINEYESSNHNI